MTAWPRQILVPILAATIVLLLLPAATLANGRVLRYVRHSAGPYAISLGTLPETPVVGNLHMSMIVVEESTNAFIPDADVTVTSRGPGEQAVEIGPLVAQMNPDDPTLYDVTTSVDREGTWTFTVGVSGALGNEASDFEIDVIRMSPVAGIVTLVALLAFLSILGLSLRAFLRQQRKAIGTRRRRR